MRSDDDSGRPLEAGHETKGSIDNEDETQPRFPHALKRVSEAIRGVTGSSDDDSAAAVPRSPYVRRYMGLDSAPSVDHTDDIPAEWLADDEADEYECYGWFHGQPMVPSRGDERRAEMNATGAAPDALAEPDDIPTTSDFIMQGHDRLTDPTGGQLVGVAAGLDESRPVSATRVSSQSGRELVPLEKLDRQTRRLRQAKVIPEDEQTPREAEGIGTSDLEVTLPDGNAVTLGTLVPDPEAYSRSSIPGIERRLALAAESEKVSAGIDEYGRTTGVAAVLDQHTELLATFRTEHDRLKPERREQRHKQKLYELAEPLRELADRDSQERDAVLKMARKILSEEFPHAHEVTKTPVRVAVELARRVLDGQDLSSALLSQVEQEKHDPRNVLKIANITYTNTAATRGYVSTQGRVKKVYYPENPNIKFGFILEDDSDWAYVAVWHPSEREITRSTSDPDDVDGEVVISKKTFMEPSEGDLVRLTDFRKGHFQGQPSLDSRWDSEIRLLESAPVDSSTNPRRHSQSGTPQRLGLSSRPSENGSAVPRSSAADYPGEVTIDWHPKALHNAFTELEESAVVSDDAAGQTPATESTTSAEVERVDTPETLGIYTPDSEPWWDSSTCWVCGCRTASMSHDSEVLAFYHPTCLTRAGVRSCTEYEAKRHENAREREFLELVRP